MKFIVLSNCSIPLLPITTKVKSVPGGQWGILFGICTFCLCLHGLTPTSFSGAHSTVGGNVHRRQPGNSESPVGVDHCLSLVALPWTRESSQVVTPPCSKTARFGSWHVVSNIGNASSNEVMTLPEEQSYSFDRGSIVIRSGTADCQKRSFCRGLSVRKASWWGSGWIKDAWTHQSGLSAEVFNFTSFAAFLGGH